MSDASVKEQIEAERREAAYAFSIGCKRSRMGCFCVSRLIGKRCNGWDCGDLRPPHVDHYSLWLSMGRAVRFVYCPYRKADEIRAEVEAWARPLGLSVIVSGPDASIYAFGTCMVEMFRARSTDSEASERTAW